MRVAIDATAVTERPSGARTRILNLYPRVRAERGIFLTCFTTAQSGIASVFRDAGHEAIELTSAIPVAFRASRNLNPVARHAFWVKGCDLLAAETLPFPAMKGIPTCVTIHDLRFRLRAFTGLPRWLYARWMLARNMVRAQAIITVSNAMKREIRNAYPRLHAERIHVVPNGVPPVHALEPFEAEKIRRNLDVAAPYTLCISHLEPRKNLDRLFRAFAMMKEELLPNSDHCLVVGGAPQPGFSRETIPIPGGEAGTRGRPAIRLLPPLSEEERAALLSGASLVVQPSLYEGFGLGVLEALHGEISVACSSIEAHREIAREAAFFFDPTNVEEMAAVMAEALENETERTAKKRKGKESAARYSWDRSAEQMAEIWKTVLTERS